MNDDNNKYINDTIGKFDSVCHESSLNIQCIGTLKYKIL